MRRLNAATGITGITLWICLPALGSGFATAQTTLASSEAQKPLATGGLISSLMASPVAGEPFSAIQVHSSKRVLADGSTISHHGHHLIARDAEGRVRVEVRLANGKNGAPDAVMVFVRDPVTQTLTTWLAGAPNDPHVATLIKLPDPTNSKTPGPPQTAADAGGPQPVVTTAELGTQTIQGLEAFGKKTTTIVPAGRSGNSAPITKTHEEWTSPELQLVIRQQWEDPRTGQRTVELEHLSRSAPDAALFRPPAGYQVKKASETLRDLEQKLEDAQQ